MDIDLDTDLDLDKVREADLEREGELQYPNRVRECDNGPHVMFAVAYPAGECHWEQRY